MQGDLRIQLSTCKSCLKGNNYLNFFNIADTRIESAKPTNLSVLELYNLIKKKQEFLINTYKTKFSKAVALKNIETG